MFVSASKGGGGATRESAGCAATSGAAAGPAVCIDRTAGNAAARTAMMKRRRSSIPKIRCSGEPNYRAEQNGNFYRKDNKNYAYRLLSPPRTCLFREDPDQICWIAESSHWPPRRRTKVHISSASSPRFPCQTGKNREKIESGQRADPARSEKTYPDQYLRVHLSSLRQRRAGKFFSLLCALAGKWQGSANESP